MAELATALLSLWLFLGDYGSKTVQAGQFERLAFLHFVHLLHYLLKE
jgi:hypothetical protein